MEREYEVRGGHGVRGLSREQWGRVADLASEDTHGHEKWYLIVRKAIRPTEYRVDGSSHERIPLVGAEYPAMSYLYCVDIICNTMARRLLEVFGDDEIVSREHGGLYDMAFFNGFGGIVVLVIRAWVRTGGVKELLFAIRTWEK